MTLIASSSGLQPLHIVSAIITGIILLTILLLVMTTIWVICSDLYRFMFSNRPRYLKLEKLRKEWNKAALTEQKRQEIAKDVIFAMIKETGSCEKLVLLYELVSINCYTRIYNLKFSAF